MIKKCDFKDCVRAGTCRAPKTRDLREYWHFCPEHVAEYNKNWNYYDNMSDAEINEDWEKQTFGTSSKNKDKANKDAKEYADFINDFIMGRDKFDKIPIKKTIPINIMDALKLFNLTINTNWREIGKTYRILAKTYHPDTAVNKKSAASEFAKISTAYKTLETYYKK